MPTTASMLAREPYGGVAREGDERMPAPVSDTDTGCTLCGAAEEEVAGRCSRCLSRGNMVGTVVWIILTREMRAAAPGQRVIAMVAGLGAAELEGIARTMPGEEIEGRSLLFRVNPLAAPGLRLGPAMLSDESPVHWRHSDAADMIVFAPPDAERDSIGAGLGPIPRLTEARIMRAVDDWLPFLGERDKGEDYLRNVLEGLNASDACRGLTMWTDFIRAIEEQGFDKPVDQRIGAAVHALQLPVEGVVKLPKWGESIDVPRPRAFTTAFNEAHATVGEYVYLRNHKQEALDLDAVRANAAAIDTTDDPVAQEAVAASLALCDRARDVRPGRWLPEQARMCRAVPWLRYGRKIFAGKGARGDTRLGRRTLDYLERDYADDIASEKAAKAPRIAADRALLETMTETARGEPTPEELDFFARWQDRLNRPEAGKLHAAWQKRLFKGEVGASDLLLTLGAGVEALLRTDGDALATMNDPRILVRPADQRKESWWDTLDQRVHRLFLFELRQMRAMLGPRFVWDCDRAFRARGLKSRPGKDARRIPLELYLVEAETADDPAFPADAPRVKAVWQPGDVAKMAPVALALPDDIAALAEEVRLDGPIVPCLTVAPRIDGAHANRLSLRDSGSFTDVTGGDEGRLVRQPGKNGRDLLIAIVKAVTRLKKESILENRATVAIATALSTFDKAYRTALLALDEDPGAAMAGETIPEQAVAFGALCRAVRLHGDAPSLSIHLQEPVARIGIVMAEGADGCAILTAWHPLRLAERRAKLMAFARFVETVMTSGTVETDLEIAFADRHRALASNLCPEATYHRGRDYVAVESSGDTTLMVPADCLSSAVEAVESTAADAAVHFGQGMRDYLAIHPHEATNLSALILDSESETLPGAVSGVIGAMLRKDADLRCDLTLSHRDLPRMRAVYAQQNRLLAEEGLGESARGLVSRLRIGVGVGGPASVQGARDFDLVFLHEAVSAFAGIRWELEPDPAEGLSADFMPKPGDPRRRSSGEAEEDAALYLTTPHPPAPVAAYYDLLYTMAKIAPVPADHHAVLTRTLAGQGGAVHDTLARAHDQGEWVVSFDRMLDRQALGRAGVQIIRDVSVPGSDARMTISSRDAGQPLRKRLHEKLSRLPVADAAETDALCDAVLRQIVGISGQKILGAARNERATSELIGLSVMRAVVEGAAPAATPPVWISLDDYRSWFTTTSGRIADAVAITVLDHATKDGDGGEDAFTVHLQVAEAKYVATAAVAAESRSAMTQLRDTADRLRTILVGNADPVSRQAWCQRLVDLLMAREALSRSVPDPARRQVFLSRMGAGDIRFALSGEAVVCVSDDVGGEPVVTASDRDAHLRLHRLPTVAIHRALATLGTGAGVAASDGSHAQWLRGDNTGGDQTAPVATADAMETSGVLPEAMAREETGDDVLRKLLGPVLATRYDRTEGRTAKTEAETWIGAEEPVVAPHPPATSLEPPAAPCSTPSPPVEPVPDRPSFIPAPAHAVLASLASDERGGDDDDALAAWVETTCRDTQRALGQFGMSAAFADPKSRLTPNGVLISFRGHPTLTERSIEKRRSELITTHGIDVADIRPGLGRITLFVRRQQRATVPLASTWLAQDWPDREPGRMASFLIGLREDDGSPLWLNLDDGFGGYESHGPHTLIAGETGSGKGVLTQSLLLQTVLFNDPREAELILIDPKKGVDFAWLDDMPHMRQSIVTEPDDACGVFARLVDEMDDRYDALRAAGTANIADFNRKAPPEERLSRIFLVHDEMGAWMAQEKEYRDTVLGSVANLGMKARAAGIHLTLITQRADVEAVPGRLRDNMGNRLCLRVQNGVGSGMVLGHPGAEKLLGRGHLAAVLNGEQVPAGVEHFTAQVPFAAVEALSRIAAAARTYWRDRMV